MLLLVLNELQAMISDAVFADDMANHWKIKGNEAYVSRDLDTAIYCYSQAIDTPVPYDRLGTEMARRATYHVNRAQAYIARAPQVDASSDKCYRYNDTFALFISSVPCVDVFVHLFTSERYCVYIEQSLLFVILSRINGGHRCIQRKGWCIYINNCI